MDITLDDLKQILTEGRLRVDLQGATCIHCALVLPTVDAAKEHDAVCEKHPLVAKLAALERELAEARRDRARLRWYFDPANAGKVIFLELRCINSGRSWTCDEWIAAIDAAMGGE